MWAEWLHNPCFLGGYQQMDKNGLCFVVQHWPLEECPQGQSLTKQKRVPKDPLAILGVPIMGGDIKMVT